MSAIKPQLLLLIFAAVVTTISVANGWSAAADPGDWDCRVTKPTPACIGKTVNPDEQVDPTIVGQQGWDNCLKTYPKARCAVAATIIAGAQNVTESVYPPGTYSVPNTITPGTYGAVLDFGGGSRACIYTTYDIAGKVIKTGSYNLVTEKAQAVITPNAAKFQTSGCTPWALTHP